LTGVALCEAGLTLTPGGYAAEKQIPISKHMKNQGLGARALKKNILAALLLGSVSAAQAAINIDV
jgi:hypothetical protein